MMGHKRSHSSSDSIEKNLSYQDSHLKLFYLPDSPRLNRWLCTGVMCISLQAVSQGV